MLTRPVNRINEIDTCSLVNSVVKRNSNEDHPRCTQVIASFSNVRNTHRKFSRARNCTIFVLSKPILSGQGETRREEKMWRSTTISSNGKFVDRHRIVWKRQLIQLAGIPPHFPGAVTTEVRTHSGESISVYGSTRSLINADPSKGIPPRTVQPLSFMFSHLRPRTIKLSDCRGERVHAWLNHCEPVCLFEMTLEINGETAE